MYKEMYKSFYELYSLKKKNNNTKIQAIRLALSIHCDQIKDSKSGYSHRYNFIASQKPKKAVDRNFCGHTNTCSDMNQNFF